MMIRRSALAFAAVGAAMLGTVAAAVPAQAADDAVNTIELRGQKDVSLGEVQKVLDATLKNPTGAAQTVAVAADTGAVPTAKQAEALLAGKSVDGMTVYRTVGKVQAADTFRGILEGTPLPAIVTYLDRNKASKMTHVVVIVCDAYCRIYTREYVIL